MNIKYLLTPALPYANGPLHLGHLLEHIQVNIFVRALRMANHQVLYVCGADSHGTPIELNAHKENVNPVDFANRWQQIQEHSLKDFGIEFDGDYGSTNTKENEAHAHKIFHALKANGHITTKTIAQLFDDKLKRFLPDRMVKGICPYCKASEQYGDACEQCGRTYLCTELIEPKSTLSNTTPVLKKSLHYFVSLNQFEDKLKAFLAHDNNVVSDDIRSSLEHWFKEGLKDWDISRDAPYFGFLIPGESDKYFYVWLDAPIGYISLSEKALSNTASTWSDYWQDDHTRIIHFIGKDIVYFHTLFWPAMLMAINYTLPHKIYVHGMVTVNGQKMSKSRGTFILADTFKNHVNPETLRYYFASKLHNNSEDIDLNFDDFIAKVNTDLVNKLVNLISRCLPLLHRYFQGQVSLLDPSWHVYEEALTLTNTVKNLYLENEPAKAILAINRFCEEANKYVQDQAPWALYKNDPQKTQAVLTTAIYAGKVCLGLLKPILPSLVSKLEGIINEGHEFTFANLSNPFLEHQVLKPYEHLIKRIEKGDIEAMITNSQQDVQEKSAHTKKINIDHFMSIDLRAAQVIKAEDVLGSDKLIALELDVGPLGRRMVFSALRPHVKSSDLVGNMVVLVANLLPRTMKFGVSEGMILACGEDVAKPLLVNEAKPGDRIR